MEDYFGSMVRAVDTQTPESILIGREGGRGRRRKNKPRPILVQGMTPKAILEMVGPSDRARSRVIIIRRGVVMACTPVGHA